MPTIGYFYAAHSAYAYLGSAKLMEVAKQAGATIVHRPMDLRKVVPAAGSTPTGERTKAHRAYFFGREIKRWSEERNAPVMDGMPTFHQNDITLPNCYLIAADEAGHNIDQLAHAFLEAHWRDNADLADASTLVRLAKGIGLDGEALLAAAGNAGIAAKYAEYTQEAIDRSVFGSPTYFVDGDMFYGQDRLELVAKALKKPYK
jgi:2-hydroxychromene-2-carboxylate isomerase